jgi:DNA-directed RNA polymerase subunit L
MKLKIVKMDESGLEISFGGEGHTLLNLLQNSLLENEEVNMAGYSKPHPLMDRSSLYVKMKVNKSPLKAVVKAVEYSEKLVNTFLEEFKTCIEEHKGNG